MNPVLSNSTKSHNHELLLGIQVLELLAPEPSASPSWVTEALDLLPESHLEEAHHCYIVLVETILRDAPVGDLAILEPWYYMLKKPEQQAQFIEYCNKQLVPDYGLVLTEYKKKGLPSDFRFEIAYSPAVSR